jgi:hypothetical protein
VVWRGTKCRNPSCYTLPCMSGCRLGDFAVVDEDGHNEPIDAMEFANKTLYISGERPHTPARTALLSLRPQSCMDRLALYCTYPPKAAGL